METSSAHRTPWILRFSCINCTPFYLLDLNLYFGPQCRIIKGTRVSLPFAVYLITHNLCTFWRCLLREMRVKTKLLCICAGCAGFAVYRFVFSFFVCDAYDIQKNKRTNEWKNNNTGESFFLTLFSTWFIDFLQIFFFFLLQDDFYDTSKRARVISNNNKSGTQTQAHQLKYFTLAISYLNKAFTWGPTKYFYFSQSVFVVI